MTFWLLDRLFEGEAAQRRREEEAERKRREKIKKRRAEWKKTQLELDKVRDSAGMGGGAMGQSDNATRGGSGTGVSKKQAVGGALNCGFGAGMEVKTGAQSGKAALPPGAQCPGIPEQNPLQGRDGGPPAKSFRRPF